MTWAVLEVAGVVTGANGANAIDGASIVGDAGEAVTGSPAQPTVTIPGTPSAGDLYFAALAMEDGMNGGSAGTLAEEGGHTNITFFDGTLETGHDIMTSTGDATPSWSG